MTIISGEPECASRRPTEAAMRGDGTEYSVNTLVQNVTVTEGERKEK